MGVDSRRPPLPAPTESMDETTSAVDTEVATNVTRATDKTSYEVPEDGSPITISTQKVTSGKRGSRPGHQRQKSQTSLLIEYFEAAKKGDKSRSRPSVRVKVTPSTAKKHKHGHDAVQITGIGKDRKPSYTRRISFDTSQKAGAGALAPTEGTELSQVSQSSESNVSGRPPVEVEVLNNGSDLSNGRRSSRGLAYAHNESNISSMPPDSMVEASNLTESEVSRDPGYNDSMVTENREGSTISENKDYLSAPIKSRDRSASRDRITQRVMEKLGATGQSSKSGHGRSLSNDYDEGYSKERRRRSKTQDTEEELASNAASSLLSSQLAPSARSYRTGTSQGSRMTNNPKLLEMVEDTIRRMILPEINAIKEDQKTDRSLRTMEGRRASLGRDEQGSDLQRRVSKSSSTPNITGKPKILLNRDGDDPGTVLSRGDSEHHKSRRSSREQSSRRSSGRHSKQSRHSEEYDEIAEEKKRIKSKSSTRDAAAAGMAGGILTAAALKDHDSQGEMQKRRKKRTKSHGSRSRSESLAESKEETYSRKEDIPPMPMASAINESDLTRPSIVSQATERPDSRHSAEVRTPVREVSRGSLGGAGSPASSRPSTRTGHSGGLGMSHHNQSISDSPISTRARLAALAAAGLDDGASKDADDHSEFSESEYYREERSKRSMASPVQSVSSLKKQFEDNDPLVPQALRPQSAASRSSAGGLRSKHASQASMGSARSSPTTQKMASKQQSGNVSGDDFVTPLEKPQAPFTRESTPGTPTGESVDDWYDRQHQLNDRYRDSMATTATNRDSYQTNPYPEDDKRFTQYTDDSYGGAEGIDMNAEQNVKGLTARPQYHQSLGVESNVASLMDPSVLSSNMQSSEATQNSSPPKQQGNFADRMQAHLREQGQDEAPLYEGSTLSENMASGDRWAAIKGHARDMSAGNSKDDVAFGGSPRQSPARSLQSPRRSVREERSVEEKPVMGASGLPVADDPLPEIGHFDDTRSEISTNPSIIKGPLGGDATGKDAWPYTPEPEKQQKQRELRESASRTSSMSALSRSERLMGAAPAGAAAFAGGAAALAAKRSNNQPSVEDERDDGRSLTLDTRHRGEEIDREATPTSPAAFRDEGYVTDAHARSAGALTPHAEQQRYSKEDMDEYNRAMDAQSLGSLREEDVFVGNKMKHQRHLSGDSHGMASPVYDRATGKGLEGIQSQDIVALMDHLTVRDAQRNARDTEILVSLVRNAAEMRQSFDEMKRYIAHQDRLIMQHTDRDADLTVQKVLSGPRPQPPSSPRTPRPSQEDMQTKRKGVLRRALKGLTGSKKTDDLAKVEDMLMQILENVEDLKQGGVPVQQPIGSYTNDTLDSSEKLRAPPDSGYEPSGRANTASTPNHSAGQLSLTPRGEKQQFHSGYDGRRGSVNRVSTVMEGDEDEDLTPDEERVLSQQFGGNDRSRTPTQSYYDRRGTSPNTYTPPQHPAAFNGASPNALTPKSAEKQRKHASNSSSQYAPPKVSRWSKTTASSAGADYRTLDSPNAPRNVRPLSEASRSGSSINRYDDEPYALHSDDRLRSTQSMAREHERPVSQGDSQSMRSQGSRLTRTPSPLIPSEASAREHDDYDRAGSPVQQDLDQEFEDPKYQAHRNSLLLQHPQPRQGTTGRHQNTLETKAQAQNYHDDVSGVSGTSSDVSQRTVSDFDPAMWGSSGTAALSRNRIPEPAGPMPMGRGSRDDDPLVPSKPAPKVYEPEPEPEPEWEPQYSNSGFSKGGYYSSPYGSGHLLEPIEEVRYSLETDRHVSPEPQVSSARAVDMRSTGRKITGPRPMGARSPGPQTNNASSVKRKPVATRAQASEDSLRSDEY